MEEEFTLLNSKLDNMNKYVSMLSNGLIMLYEILKVWKMYRNYKGMGFKSNSKNKEVKVLYKKFIPPKKKSEFLMVDHMSQQPATHVNPYCKGSKNFEKSCHNCGRYGHIRPYCFRLYGCPQLWRPPKPKKKVKKV